MFTFAAFWRITTTLSNDWLTKAHSMFKMEIFKIDVNESLDRTVSSPSHLHEQHEFLNNRTKYYGFDRINICLHNSTFCHNFCSSSKYNYCKMLPFKWKAIESINSPLPELDDFKIIKHFCFRLLFPIMIDEDYCKRESKSICFQVCLINGKKGPTAYKGFKIIIVVYINSTQLKVHLWQSLIRQIFTIITYAISALIGSVADDLAIWSSWFLSEIVIDPFSHIGNFCEPLIC